MLPLDFIGSLQKVFDLIFDKVLKPVLMIIFKELFKILWDLIMATLGPILMRLLIVVLKIVDFFSNIFDIFAGTRYVHYTDGGQHALAVAEKVYRGGELTQLDKGTIVPYTQTYLTDLFLSYGPVARAFWYITAFAVVLAFMFAIFAVAKSAHEAAVDGANTLSSALKRAAKTALHFLLVPAMVWMVLQLSTTILVQVSDSVNMANGAKTTLGSLVFLTGGMSSGKQSVGNPGFRDLLRDQFYTLPANGVPLYEDYDKVENCFEISKYNYIVAFGCALVLLFMMFIALLGLVRRLFELAALYLVSPIFVAVMPLDDGAMFKKWRDMFIAKMFAAFGTVFMIKLFFAVTPFLMGGDLKLSPDPTVDTLLKMVLVLGGVWGANECQHTFLELLSPEAAQSAKESGGAMLGMAVAVGGAAKGLASAVRGAVSSPQGAGGAGGKSGGEAGGGSNTAAIAPKSSNGGGALPAGGE